MVQRFVAKQHMSLQQFSSQFNTIVLFDEKVIFYVLKICFINFFFQFIHSFSFIRFYPFIHHYRHHHHLYHHHRHHHHYHHHHHHHHHHHRHHHHHHPHQCDLLGRFLDTLHSLLTRDPEWTRGWRMRKWLKNLFRIMTN